MSTFVLEFKGLLALIVTPTRASVICVDATIDRSGHQHPRHVASFEASRSSIVAGSAPPDAAYPPLKAAWNIEGATVDVFPIGARPTSTAPATSARAPIADAATPASGADDWASCEWIANLPRAYPGATLRSDWDRCYTVQARIDLWGGHIQALPPEGAMANALWKFGDAPAQILTNRFAYTLPGDAAGFEVHLRGRAKDRTILLTPDPALGGKVLAAVHHVPMIETPLDVSPHASHAHGHHAPAAASVEPALPPIHHISACYELLTQPGPRPVPTFAGWVGKKQLGEVPPGCVPVEIVVE